MTAPGGILSPAGAAPRQPPQRRTAAWPFSRPLRLACALRSRQESPECLPSLPSLPGLPGLNCGSVDQGDREDREDLFSRYGGTSVRPKSFEFLVGGAGV